MGRFDEVKATINANIKTNGKQEITGKVLNHVMNKMIDATDAHLLEADGRYPKMSVGFADDLVGRGESVPAEFSFRASGGKSIKDGSARIKRLKGNSVVWNNKARKYYLNQSASELRLDDGIPQGHIFLMTRTVATGELWYLPQADLYAYYLSIGQYGKIMTCNHTEDKSFVRMYATDESGYVQLIDLTLMFGAGNEPTTIEEYEARKTIVADEYAYNEGEVIHMTAEGIKSIGDNAWDEEWRLGIYGSSEGIYVQNSSCICNARPIRVLPNTDYYFNPGVEAYAFYYDKNMTFIKYEGGYGVIKTPSNAEYLNFYLGAGYGTQYNNDITISLYHSGWKAEKDDQYQPYWEDRLMFDKRIKDAFPNGMQRWNMVYNKNGKGYIVKGMGVVEDMSKMDWERNIDGRFQASIIGALLPPSTDMVGNIMCNRYATNSADDTYLGLIGISLDSYGYVWARDDAYTDAASLKESLQGVPLYYQLAEPTIIEYDEPFNLDYKVADFGTEQAIAEQPSAPLAADIIYQFNAVDMIREHELEITELQRIIATMQAQLTSLTSPTRL